MIYEAATIFHRQPHILPTESGTFIQYAADNSDRNVYTLDGHNTLKSSALVEEALPRVNKMLTAKDARNNVVVGYRKIIAQNFAYESRAIISLLRKIDILWLYGKWSNLSLPGWNGYIER